MNTIQLIIKGTIADAETQLDARGFHTEDRVTPITQHQSGSHVYTMVTVKSECEPGVQRWFSEVPTEPPFPVGTLLHYTMSKPVEALKPDFDTALTALLAAAQAKIDAYYAEHSFTSKTTLRTEAGQRYVRVISGTGVYCFIDKTNGNVLKAASWKAPVTKNPRSNIYDADHGASGVDWHGAVYLR